MMTQPETAGISAISVNADVAADTENWTGPGDKLSVVIAGFIPAIHIAANAGAC
jgi:hypothetical protein